MAEPVPVEAPPVEVPPVEAPPVEAPPVEAPQNPPVENIPTLSEGDVTVDIVGDTTDQRTPRELTPIPSIEDIPSLSEGNVTIDLERESNELMTHATDSLWKVMQNIIKNVKETEIDATFLKKYDISLSAKSKQLLFKLIDDRDFLDDIESKLKMIIKDDKIDANDIPVILDMFQDLYAKFKSMQWKKIQAEDCGNVLRIMIKVAIAEKVIQLNVPDAVIIACVNTLIKNAVKLMKLMEGCFCC